MIIMFVHNSMSHAVTIPPEAVVTAIVEDGSSEFNDTEKVYSYLITS